MPTNVLEETTLKLEARVYRTNSAFGKSAKKAVFSFKKDGQPIDLETEEVEAGTRQEKTVNEKVTRATVTMPRVEDDTDHYTLTYRATLGRRDGRDFAQNNSYIVWASSLDLELEADDSGEGDPPTVGLFRVYQSGNMIYDRCEIPLGEAHSIGLNACGPVSIEPISPYELEPGGEAPNARKRTGTVSKKPYKVKILNFRAGTTRAAPHKQYVNLPRNAARGHGYDQIRIELGADGERELAQEGDEIHVKVTFDRGKSQRTTPRRGVRNQDGDVAPDVPDAAEPTHTFKAKIGADHVAALSLDVGIAGGDLVHIEAGVTATREDASLWIQNWRKLPYESLHPYPEAGADCVSTHTSTAGAPAALAGDILTGLETEYARAFVDFECLRSTYFRKSQLPAHVQPQVLDGAHFGSNGTCLVLTDDDLFDLQMTLGTVAMPKRLLSLVFTDFKAKHIEFPLNALVDAVETNHDLADPNCVMPTSVAISAACVPGTSVSTRSLPAGTSSIRRVAWQAAKYKHATWPAWYDISADTDPAGAMRGWTDVAATDFDDWVEILSKNRVKITLSATNPGDPGNQLTIHHTDGSDYAIQYRVYIDFHGIDLQSPGGAYRGRVFIALGPNANTRDAMCMIKHEIGHCCGQAYVSQVTDPRGLLPEYEIPGMAFPPDVDNNGHYYGGRGHVGPHCAQGIAQNLREMDDYVFQDHVDQAACVMFGWVTDNEFCDDCLKYLKAQDLSDITKSWRGP